ncbi:RagB/SusD family nutrient uptake outer membrane protein [Sphingobacterium sp. HMA12]|uniref:RagB/SusD family nutrient uptake outer membrane protein n=1 Tax=Sphingobacterium sp. HMA12 TaxID=2050894 RepID=UPI0018F85F1F|nr:RagB/SusD family nutrient uptake outer membrane protein [Sphingobacterium sp. HMA12]
MMKQLYKSMLFLGIMSWTTACTDILDVEPNNKVPADKVLNSEEGVAMHMANLYGRLPVEDFSYAIDKGFSLGIGNTNPNNGGRSAAHASDEAMHSEFNDDVDEGFNFWEGYIDGDGTYKNWRGIYTLIRDINGLIETIPTLTKISNDEKLKLEGEAAFLRAFTYYALAKRYGGVPLIKEMQVYNGSVEDLKVPRSTEKETWDFILSDCDIAAEKLSDSPSDTRRANKWIALALKSRAALYAASVAKFTHAPYVSFSGPAVDLKLVGIDASEADRYYSECIAASSEIIKSGHYGLYGADPATKEEAINNYKQMFENPNSVLSGVKEPMFIKGYTSGTVLAHNYDIWYRPNQTANGWPHPGRMNPTLDLVDAYEDYTDNGLGASTAVKTRVDGNESTYGGFDKNVQYYAFPIDKPYELFENKDARLWATMILPGTSWKDNKIIIQGGIIKPDGSYIFRTDASVTGLDGKTYYTYGAEKANQYSGFSPVGGNYTRSGFLLRKFLQEKETVTAEWNKGANDWIEFRYAEVLLNYAEAAAEKFAATGEDKTMGKKALNEVRKRAAHKDEIGLTVDNVRKERLVEFAFENKRRWDLNRWRTYHKLFENRMKRSLVPFLDLRGATPKYIFVRMNPPGYNNQTYTYSRYYRQIPGIGSNGLVQNP